MINKSIHDLVLSDFDNNTIWTITDYDVSDGVDSLVRPLRDYKNTDIIDRDVWVRIDCKMSDGTKFKGIALFDLKTGYLSNYSFYLNDKWIVLFLKPAPDFVLEKDGPIPFAKELNKDIKEVFPMILKPELINDIFEDRFIKTIENE